MYFPYLRGRQFELLAIRELVEKDLLKNKVIPIIEPVKLTSTLIKTIEAFIEKEAYIGIVINPHVGNFLEDLEAEASTNLVNKYKELFKSTFLIKALIMNRDVSSLIEKLEKENSVLRNQLIVVCNKKDYVNEYKKIFMTYSPKYVLIPDELRRDVKENRVLFEDTFEKQNRNAAYLNAVDEFFSMNHIYYKEENYIGFGDYSIIGDAYSESGFAPYAVAIHIVYMDSNDSLRVRHFVSDSNGDIRNPAGKFYEACEKLNDWYVEVGEEERTIGLDGFIQLYNEQAYPGLGSVKKLSLMHHLELIARYLEKNFK